jgi:hypothetical protein
MQTGHASISLFAENFLPQTEQMRIFRFVNPLPFWPVDPRFYGGYAHFDLLRHFF